ncbi:MAG: xanthine dehydrogenase family protein molybdopterin-binding subunit [Desulfobacterota bacterium]|nr:xanthine dehydrogenase family protein molybdopterin-binding subunit [Thermodesulfobacteriota bacterium]
MSTYSIVGRSVPQIDGREKAQGKLEFITDLELPGMLYGKVLRSPLPHARIVSIDPSRAKRLRGVRAVVTAEDTPKIPFGPRTEDWQIFAVDKVRFIGDEVAAVAAVDEETAEEALDLIRVEYEELPAVFDPIEAMKPGAPLIHDRPNNIVSEFRLERGDVERAFRECDVVHAGRYYTNQVYQAYLEPMACIAHVDPSGRLTLYLATQIPSMTRLTYAKALGLPLEKVRVVVPPYGGAFGAKMETNLHLAAAVLSQKTGRPVRMVNSREEDFMAGNPRVPMYIDLKVGAKKDGRLIAKEVRVIGGSGARAIYSMAIVATACYRVDSLYRFEHLKTEGLTVYTNTVPTSCFRGFGNAQMTFALESTLDMIAEAIGMDPAELRIRNGLKTGEVSIHGWQIGSSGLEECVRRAVEVSGWEEKRRQKRFARGIGLACCNHVSGNRAFSREFDGGAGIVRIGREGKVLVYHGESDMGQGQRTVFSQIVAEALGVGLDRIEVAQVDTEISPFGLGSFATRGTVFGGNGLKAAAEAAKQQLLEGVAEIFETSPSALEIREGKVFVRDEPERCLPFEKVAEACMLRRGGAPVVGTGFWVPDTELPDPVTKYGNISPAYPFACQIAEVEVDTETGQVNVIRYTAAHDVGRAINPQAIEGQIHGGVAQGIGWALTEDMILRDGKVLNPDFRDYVMPGPLDLPPIQTILVEPVDPNGPYGAKGIGEPALNPSPAAVANAIYDAIGIRFTELPITPEKILKALKAKKRGSHG